MPQVEMIPHGEIEEFVAMKLVRSEGIGRYVDPDLIRRLILIPAWMIGSAVAIALGLTFLIHWLISPGLGRTDTAEIAAALGVVTLTLVVFIYVGVLGYRGRLPGTSRRDTPGEPKREGRKFMGKAFAALGIVMVAAAIAAIVSAAVTVAYVPEVYERQARSGEVDWILTVESEVLRETRDLRVHLPDGYDTELDRWYPLLLVLDGGWQLDYTHGAALTLEWLGLGEPMIEVGVINGVAGRSVDFVPPEQSEGARAHRFLEFIETEALPAIDRDLRTNSTLLIAGHSLGGLSAIYSLVQRPELFTGRFAFSPSLWRRDQAMV